MIQLLRDVIEEVEEVLSRARRSVMPASEPLIFRESAIKSISKDKSKAYYYAWPHRPSSSFSGLSSRMYAGSLCDAQIQVRSQRVLSLLPGVNQILGK